jgi:putative membrane protein
MKKITSLLFALALLTWACNNESKDSVEKADSTNQANADSGNTQQPVVADAESASFLVKAANGGMAEVQMGELAQQKGKAESVKNFGAMMVHDHSAANDKVKAFAGQRNVTLPATVSDEEQKTIDDLNKKSGADFDKAYVNTMVKGHESTIDLFEKAGDKVNDTEIKGFITSTLPTIRMHLDSVKAIQKKLK